MMTNQELPIMNHELSILEETDHWLVIDKPAGLIVHPAAVSSESQKSNVKGQMFTVVDWLILRYPEIINLSWPDMSRPGIVHRLDTDTSGVLLLAKDPATLAVLQQQFQDRTVKKTYQGLVLGSAPESETLTGSISRKSGGVEQQVRRLSFSWEKRPMKPAETELSSLQHLQDNQGKQFTFVELEPKTGRTHQLRVQLLDANLPMIGDQQYNTKASREASVELGLARQFLHAVQLEFTDTATGERISIKSSLPPDLQAVIGKLSSTTSMSIREKDPWQ